MTIPESETVPLKPSRLPANLTRKLVQMGLLLVVTMLVSWPISGVIDEREERQQGLLSEFQHSWGPQQNLHSPILVLPYQTAADQPRMYLKIAPTMLKAQIGLTPEERKRGLFHAIVYGATADLQGTFTLPADARAALGLDKNGQVFWAESFVMLETSGLSGLAPGDHLGWNGQDEPWQNCREVVSRADDCQQSTMIVAQPHLASALSGQVSFHATLSLRGSGSFHLAAQGRTLDAAISAPWTTPSFSGSALPSSSSVTAQGFEAHWQAVDYSSPQLWISKHLAEDASTGTVAGVELLEATPTYRMIHRASKYNILFVVLSFTTYFLFELLSGLRIHAFQYGLLGLSLTLFTLLLVSFSEPLGYDAGYAVSAGMVLLQASLYTATVSRRPRHAVIFGAMLGALFGFLYVLLSLETYSLLVGAVALFAVLSAVMMLTRRVDWSNGEQG